MGYFKDADKPRTDSPAEGEDPLQQETWAEDFLHGDQDTRFDALQHLVKAGREAPLLSALKSGDRSLQETAIYGLMECWVSECGLDARKQLEVAQTAIDEFNYHKAEQLLVQLIKAHEGWAEPLHKLAELRYFQGQNEDAVLLNGKALHYKPHHFGAWHGIALNLAELKRWNLAWEASRRALAIRPDCKASQAIYAQALTRLS